MSTHCNRRLHSNLEGDNFLIIGGYESGIDAAYHLAKNDKKVSVFDMEGPWESESSDPSVALSTYSFERMRHEKFEENVSCTPFNCHSSQSG